MTDPGFPVTLKHPQHRPAVLSTVDPSAGNWQDIAGRPEMYPDVSVNNETQEAQYRSKGYLRPGESAPVYDASLEFPKLLCHPDHEDGAQATQVSVAGSDGVVKVVNVPARPEKFPNVTVKNAQEEDSWAEKGYYPAGHFDGAAYEKALWAEGEAGDEYPRWEEDENGNPILVDDPNRPADESRLYPMMIYAPNGEELGVAKNAAEATALKTRGSAKNEPQRQPPQKYVPTPVAAAVNAADFAEWQEFQAFKAWKAAQQAGASEMMVPPQDVAKAESEPPKVTDDAIEALRKEASELGIAVDKRWGERTLRAEIDLALSK